MQRVQSNDIAVIKKYGKQVSKLNKDTPEILITAISAMIESIYTLVNVGKQINEHAIIKLAEMIIENYWYLKIDEIDLVFKNGITGKYGKIYDRVDASVIFDWLHQYDVSDECISIYEDEASDFKKREHDSSILLDSEFRGMLKKAIDIKEPFEDGLTNEEHAENVRKQAETIMKNNEKS